MPYTIDGDYVDHGFDGYTVDGDPRYRQPINGDDVQHIISDLIKRVDALENLFRANIDNPTVKDAWEKYLLTRELSK